MKTVQLILLKFSCLSLFSFAACSSNSFTKSADVKVLEIGDLSGEFLFTAGSETLTWNQGFKEVAGSPSGARKFLPIKGASSVEKSEKFPKEIAETILASDLIGLLESSADAAQTHKVRFTLTPKGDLAPVELSQTSTSLSWEKDEGDVEAFGKLPVESESGTKCSLEASGQQPKMGLYSVILTKPAACDFKLPKVKVGNVRGTAQETIDIGSYWICALCSKRKAHSLDISDEMNKKYVDFAVDNGFILLQPNGESFLLIDAGVALPESRKYKTTEQIANDVSQSLGWGKTILKRATPTQVFAKGSIIAIYDDTPDMGGSLNVEALISLAVMPGLHLKWTASSKH